MFCYFLSWEELVNLRSMVGVNAGSQAPRIREEKSFEFQPLTQCFSGFPCGPPWLQGMLLSLQQHTLSRKCSVCHPPKCQPGGRGFVYSLAESSATSPIQKSPWSPKQAGGCLALTDSCCAGSWLLKISIFILSCSCCQPAMWQRLLSFFVVFFFWCYLQFLCFSIVPGRIGICFSCLKHISIKNI